MMNKQLTQSELKLAIVKHRFPFPNPDKPAWRTYINTISDLQLGIATPNGEVFPDIVVVDKATVTNRYVMAACILTGEPTDEDAENWRRVIEAVDAFYLFVPEGRCQKASEVAAQAGIEVTGFRWFRRDGEDVEIFDCF